MKTLKQKNKKTIVVSAPGKLMFLGDHAVVYGFPCLVTAVNYRVFVELSLSEKDECIFPKNINNTLFITKALEMFRKKYNMHHPIHLKTWANYEESYGLGSSSAVTVSLVKALSLLFSISLSQKELFDFCYKIVLSVQGVGSGFDIAAAIWGGTLYFVTGGKKIEPLNIDSLPLIVAYSGTKGNTPILVKGVTKLYKEKHSEIQKLFIKSQESVEKGRVCLLKNDMRSFGKLMRENHAILQQLHVSTPKLDELVASASEAGAYGAKLSGAGGGDCIIAITPFDKRKEVEKALENAGGIILPIKTNEEGVRRE
jgi:mevalonate kinase